MVVEADMGPITSTRQGIIRGAIAGACCAAVLWLPLVVAVLFGMLVGSGNDVSSGEPAHPMFGTLVLLAVICGLGAFAGACWGGVMGFISVRVAAARGEVAVDPRVHLPAYRVEPNDQAPMDSRK